jgi:hypothetical protein
MEAQPARGIVIGPMSIGEVVDSGFTLARRNFRYLASIGAWGMAVSLIVITLLSLGAGDPTSPTGAVNAAVRGFLGGVAAGIASLAIAVACARLIEPTGGDPRITAADAYRLAARRIPTLIGLAIVAGLASIPLAIILPLGIFIWVRWSSSAYACLIDGLGPIAALRRSWHLTRRAWWHTAVVLFVMSLAVGVIQIVLQGIFELAIAGVSFLLSSAFISAFLHALATAMFAIVLLPFSTAVPIVLYYELRARAEGFDLERRMLQAALAE